MENNQMVSFEKMKSLFNQNKVYIPLIQRNYKWSADIAAKLIWDLWGAFEKKQDSYTIGMITLYKENDTKLQLIDGQQRIITLYMILKFIEPDKEYYSFEIERDEGIFEAGEKRIDYLKNINMCSSWCKKITDVERFKENYLAIEKKMQDTYDATKKDAFIEYIFNNLYFLLHISETEPFDEFMNLNNNKTRFVISDRIKANLMIDAKEAKVEVLDLFRKLSESLFADPEIWKLVNQGYCEKVVPQDKSKRRKDKHYPDENRLKLLCCERYGSDDYDVSGTLGYEFKEEMKILTRYRNILHTLTCDRKDGNWNNFNGFNCLYSISANEKENGIRFFELLKDGKYEILEKYFIEEIKNDSSFNKACFIESQLQNEKIEIDYIQSSETIKTSFNANEKSGWFSGENEYFDVFVEMYDSYIERKYQQRTEENKYGVK